MYTLSQNWEPDYINYYCFILSYLSSFVSVVSTLTCFCHCANTIIVVFIIIITIIVVVTIINIFYFNLEDPTPALRIVSSS